LPLFAALFFVGWCYVSWDGGFDWDDADPEILNQAWRLAQGNEIYRGIDSPPFAFAAYTPLYYGLVGLLLKLTGLSFLPARAVSMLSALAIARAMMLLGRRWHSGRAAGFGAACVLFVIPAFLYNATRSHPQMLAVALSVWSLFFLLRKDRTFDVILSALLAMLAFHTKQTQVALPLAGVIYLALRDRRRLIPYLAALAVTGVLPLLWLQKLTDGYFLYDTVQLARIAYSVLQIVPVFLHHGGPLLVFMIAAAHLSGQRFRAGRWDVLDCYFAVLFLTTLVSLGRLGAHGQYLLELLVVTVIFLLRSFRGLPVRGRELWISVQILFLLIYTPLFIAVEEGPRNVAASRAAQKIYPLISTGAGPILSQQGSFPLFARGEIHIQLFHFTALHRAGLWDQRLLLGEIERRAFSWIITEFALEESVLSDDDRERFTPEMVEALRQNYSRRAAIYPYYLYRPRE